jgi:hypothetical protein
MRQVNGFWANHTAGSIHRLAASAGRLFEPWPWSLVTSLDSLCDLRDVVRRRAFKTIADEAVVVGTAILVSTARLIEIAKGGCLTGFDEVWFLSRTPAAAPPQGDDRGATGCGPWRPDGRDRLDEKRGLRLGARGWNGPELRDGFAGGSIRT